RNPTVLLGLLTALSIACIALTDPAPLAVLYVLLAAGGDARVPAGPGADAARPAAVPGLRGRWLLRERAQPARVRALARAAGADHAGGHRAGSGPRAACAGDRPRRGRGHAGHRSAQHRGEPAAACAPAGPLRLCAAGR